MNEDYEIISYGIRFDDDKKVDLILIRYIIE
jgi:hypothetical protein